MSPFLPVYITYKKYKDIYIGYIDIFIKISINRGPYTASFFKVVKAVYGN